MSKKRFTEGMESLFWEMDQDDSQKESPLLVETKVKRKEKPKKETEKSKPRTSSSAKDFSHELEDIFKETLEEKIEERQQQKAEKKRESKRSQRKKRRSPRPADGLDALIRRTIETSQLEVNYEARKRLVLTLEKEKLDKLKAIAKKEKTYLKDIVGRIVEEFLSQYDSD